MYCIPGDPLDQGILSLLGNPSNNNNNINNNNTVTMYACRAMSFFALLNVLILQFYVLSW